MFAHHKPIPSLPGYLSPGICRTWLSLKTEANFGRSSDSKRVSWEFRSVKVLRAALQVKIPVQNTRGSPDNFYKKHTGSHFQPSNSEERLQSFNFKPAASLAATTIGATKIISGGLQQVEGNWEADGPLALIAWYSTWSHKPQVAWVCMSIMSHIREIKMSETFF